MIVISLVAGLILAILAPLETHTVPLLWRFIGWVGMCLAGGFGAGIVNVFVKLRGIKLPLWLSAFLQSITASLAVASVMFIWAYSQYGLPSWQSTLTSLFYIWVISMTISAVGMLIGNHKNPVVEKDSRPALYERLPMNLRNANIYALAAEDHYVRVITSNGDDLILMRLRDAINETAPLAGLYPHRSWWVAQDGVEKIGKSDITIKSGQTVPISRSGAKLVRTNGWS